MYSSRIGILLLASVLVLESDTIIDADSLKIIKKSISPSDFEIKNNPRSRSARLRIAECL